MEIGRRLARLAEAGQVVVVTHLPQVAAFADHHLVVTKADDGTGHGLRRACRARARPGCRRSPGCWPGSARRQPPPTPASSRTAAGRCCPTRRRTAPAASDPSAEQAGRPATRSAPDHGTSDGSAPGRDRLVRCGVRRRRAVTATTPGWWGPHGSPTPAACPAVAGVRATWPCSTCRTWTPPPPRGCSSTRPAAVLLAGPATSRRYPHRGPELLLASRRPSWSTGWARTCWSRCATASRCGSTAAG